MENAMSFKKEVQRFDSGEVEVFCVISLGDNDIGSFLISKKENSLCIDSIEIYNDFRGKKLSSFLFNKLNEELNLLKSKVTNFIYLEVFPFSNSPLTFNDLKSLYSKYLGLNDTIYPRLMIKTVDGYSEPIAVEEAKELAC